MRHAAWPGLLLLCACSATPSRPAALGSPLGLWARFLSPAAIGNDLHTIAGHAGDAARGELARGSDLPDRLGEAAGHELDRGRRVPTAVHALGSEAERLGPATAAARGLAARLAGDPIAALAVAPAVTGLDRPWLSEPDDRRHRTDPADDRPEPTLWERLRRRLRL